MEACLEYVNKTSNTTDTPSRDACYPWVVKDIAGQNVSLDEVNAVAMKGAYSGIILLAITSVLGTIGNAHVIFVFSKRKYNSTENAIQRSIHVNYRIFILWLAILGIFLCLVSSPLMIVNLMYPVNFQSYFLCKTYRFISYLSFNTMTLAYLAVAVDRYLVMCKTFQNRLTEKYSILVCIATVFIGSCFACPALILFGRGKTPTGIEGLVGYKCYFDYEQEESVLKYFQIYQSFLIAFFFFVLITLFILYSRVRNAYKIMLKFRHNSRRYTSSTPESSKERIEDTEILLLRIYGSVTISYAVCALPVHLIAVLWFFKVSFGCEMSFQESQIYYVFALSHTLSPVINPIIYGFQDDGFRSSIRAIFRKMTPRTYWFSRQT